MITPPKFPFLMYSLVESQPRGVDRMTRRFLLAAGGLWMGLLAGCSKFPLSGPRKPSACSGCNGTGKASCLSCNGTGSWPGLIDPNAKPAPPRTCAMCNGAGKRPCGMCGGKGKF
jgi:hypothetical protein